MLLTNSNKERTVCSIADCPFLQVNCHIWSGIYQAAVWSNLVLWDRYPADIPWFGASCVVRCNNTSWVHQWWWTAHNHYADTPGTWSVFPLFHFHPEKDDTESPAFNLLMMHFSWNSSRVMTNSPSFSWQFHTIYESVPFFRMKLLEDFSFSLQTGGHQIHIRWAFLWLVLP